MSGILSGCVERCDLVTDVVGIGSAGANSVETFLAVS